MRSASTRFSPGADHLDQRHLARDVRAFRGQVGTRCTGTSRSSCALICSITISRAGGDDVDARAAALVIDRRDGQAVDVVAAAGEQADDARQDAGLVVHQDRDRRAAQCGVGHGESGASSCRVVTARNRRQRAAADGGRLAMTLRVSDQHRPSSVMPAASVLVLGPRIISLCAAPHGIIGKQFSFWSTAMSAITGAVGGQHLADHVVQLVRPSRRAGRRRGSCRPA